MLVELLSILSLVFYIFLLHTAKLLGSFLAVTVSVFFI